MEASIHRSGVKREHRELRAPWENHSLDKREEEEVQLQVLIDDFLAVSDDEILETNGISRASSSP